MTTFNLPDLGEGLAEAEIVRWHINVGDAVTVDQPMLAVETAKAVVEVPAPFSGIVKTLYGQPGDVIATGAPLIDFELVRGAAPSTDTGTVVGNMPTSDTELIETAHAGSSTYNRTNGGTNSASGANSVAGPNSAGGRLRAAPAARALAKRLGVDLIGLQGSGRGGVIIVDDVITHSSLITHSSAIARSNTTPGASNATAARPSFEGGEKLRGLRRAMSQSMSLARDNVASCTVFDDAAAAGAVESAEVDAQAFGERACGGGCA